jgi:MFS transporter, CP family, cyanate transporter
LAQLEAVSSQGGKTGLVVPVMLLWLSGAGLRLTLLAVPPVIPLIHRDLALSETAIGTLGSLPPLLFACAAIPGSLLIARLGAVRTLVIGLVLTGLASAARGLADDVAALFLATILMSAGVAVMQPALPPVVRLWLPQRIGFATAVYTNGLLMAEIIAVAATLPVILPLAGGSWRLSFALWSLPLLATAILVQTLAPRTAAPSAASALRLRRWWPDWHDPLIWRLAFLLGSINTVYFGTNTFLPDFLHAQGRPDLIGPALSALNGGQIPASLLMLVCAGKLVRRHAAYIAAGAMLLASILGMIFLPGAWIVFCAGTLGFATAVGLVLLLALPPLLSPSEDVHRVLAGMFTVSYPCAVIFPILGGYGWDATGIPALAFAPVVLASLAVIALSPGIRFGRNG